MYLLFNSLVYIFHTVFYTRPFMHDLFHTALNIWSFPHGSKHLVYCTWAFTRGLLHTIFVRYILQYILRILYRKALLYVQLLSVVDHFTYHLYLYFRHCECNCNGIKPFRISIIFIFSLERCYQLKVLQNQAFSSTCMIK